MKSSSRCEAKSRCESRMQLIRVEGIWRIAQKSIIVVGAEGMMPTVGI